MQTVIDTLNKQNLDGIFLVNDSNIRYVNHFTGADSFVLLLQDKKYFITDYRYTEQAEEECQDFEIITVNREIETLEEKVAEIAVTHRIKRLAFEKSHLTYMIYENLNKEMKDTELIPTEGIVEAFRYIKNKEEIDYIKKASQITDNAFEQILGFLKPGITEMEAAHELELIIRKGGAEDIAFPIILISGQNTSKPHGIPSHKKIEPGDFITLDFGALYNGYRSDMTRTIIMGNPNQKQQKVYDIVKEAQTAGVKAVRDGISGFDVNQQVQNIFTCYDYQRYAGKGIGHGVGLDLHEKPFMDIKCQDILKSNCVITMEPGIYIPFWGGVRIEDTLLVTKEGSETLSTSSRDLIIL